ncbi:hypothetical protein [Thiovibrio frasassiensis]|uniref:Uncharacterized protein n=1 Tax=Thiovibrio frasassiensis TaxID=2984131 RepID=A0A9X4RN11_9BACT|nr:hypothetical protein [Thiovibrio frasassiensis]MDG4476795.1 hypothetical protein [Thiovibrio frasassiensis]
MQHGVLLRFFSYSLRRKSPALRIFRVWIDEALGAFFIGMLCPMLVGSQWKNLKRIFVVYRISVMFFGKLASVHFFAELYALQGTKKRTKEMAPRVSCPAESGMPGVYPLRELLDAAGALQTRGVYARKGTSNSRSLRHCVASLT